MAVYVDPLFTWGNQGQWCHMIADTLDELHHFASQIGLKRSWVHTSSTGIVHYDLRPSKRALAIQHGAIPVSAQEFIARAKETNR